MALSAVVWVFSVIYTRGISVRSRSEFLSPGKAKGQDTDQTRLHCHCLEYRDNAVNPQSTPVTSCSVLQEDTAPPLL